MTEPVFNSLRPHARYGDLPEVVTEGTEVVHGADGPPADHPVQFGDPDVGPYVDGETPAYDGAPPPHEDRVAIHFAEHLHGPIDGCPLCDDGVEKIVDALEGMKP